MKSPFSHFFAMNLGSVAFALGVSAAAMARAPSRPIPPGPPDSPVILFLIDNSASLPPLDPKGRRREALARIFSLLGDEPYRLILFGGRQEIAVDRPELYVNNGQWTDFFFAFREAETVMAGYPDRTRFKMILITDGIPDPHPADWNDQDLARGSAIKRVSTSRATELLSKLRTPLYAIMVGDQVDSRVVNDFVRAANGSTASHAYVQGLSDFFDSNGLFVERFVFRVEPQDGLPMIEKVVSRIIAPPDVRVEVSLTGALLLGIAVVIGVGVRSFPGAGDREIIDLSFGRSAHLGVDRLRRLASGVPAWSWRGLSLLDSAREAAASVTLIHLNHEFPPDGLDLSRLDPLAQRLVALPMPALHEELDKLQKSGKKEEAIYALNLDYAARSFNAARAEKILTAGVTERRKEDPHDFLHAKVHLLFDDTLYQRLRAPRVTCILYGQAELKRDLRAGSRVKIGRYQFEVTEIALGGRKDGRLVLAYEKVPSRLGLKTIIPGFLQRLLRLRRSHERVVV